MAEVRISDPRVTIVATFRNGAKYPGINHNSSLVTLIGQCERFHAVIPLVLVDFKPERDDPNQGGSRAFNYRFVARDGRVWDQTLHFANDVDADPRMSIAMHGWKLSEFLFHRDIRDGLIQLRSQHTLEIMEMKWA